MIRKPEPRAPGATAAAGEVRRGRAEVAALLLWIAAAIGISLRLLLAKDPTRNNVYLTVFAPAADAFWARGELYPDGAQGFRYPPITAALLGAFTAAGPVLGSVLWRLANMAVLFVGLRSACRAGLPVALTSGERALGLALAAAIGVGGFNNGQANALVLGCLLLATTAAMRARTAAPGLLVGAATAVKVYPFASGMVLATLRPRLWPALAAALALLLFLPYLLAPAGWLTAQYEALARGLSAEDRTGDLANAYRDLRLLFAAIGAPLPPRAFLLLQALGGLAIVLGARRLRRVGDARAFAFATGATLCWMLLLGPSTEKVTYQFLAVPLTWQLALARRHGGRTARWLLWPALALAVLDVLPVTPPRDLQAAWPALRCLSPLAALLVAIDLARDCATATAGDPEPVRDSGGAAS